MYDRTSTLEYLEITNSAFNNLTYYFALVLRPLKYRYRYQPKSGELSKYHPLIIVPSPIMPQMNPELFFSAFKGFLCKLCMFREKTMAIRTALKY